MNTLLFQYCQKILVFRNNDTEILLAKRKGEQDFDGVYSFIGGKMETTDKSIVKGVQREKNEEVGEQVTLNLLADFTHNILYRKKDGNSMILPHYYAEYIKGEIELNEEYSEYKWVKLEELENFEPKIDTIPKIAKKMLNIKNSVKGLKFVEI